MKKAVIIDPYSSESYHEVINTSFIIMIGLNFDKLTYKADVLSCNHLKKLLNKDNPDINLKITWKPIKTYQNRGGGLGYLLKLISVFILDTYHYLSSSKDEIVFFNNNMIFGLPLFNLLVKVKKNKAYVMCHSEMEHIKNKKNNGSIVLKLIHLYLNFFFNKCKINKNLKFILLGDKMKEYFCSNINKKNRLNILSLDHSYYRPKTKFDKKCIINNKNIKIGITSLINKDRGLNELIYILEKTNNKELNFNIYIISKIISNQQNKYNALTILNKSDNLMPFNEYTSYVCEMDFILLTYEIDSYKLTASGAILEAIWNRKPILALKNSYTTYLFEKFGEMGILCSSIDELVDILININLITQNDINKWLKNIDYAKSYLHPQNLSKQLYNII
jgi:hypothetical protein